MPKEYRDERTDLIPEFAVGVPRLGSPRKPSPYETGGEKPGRIPLTPGEQALYAVDEFRNAILQERIAQRKRQQQLEMRSQRAAQAAARMRMTGGGTLPQKGGTIMTGPLGVLKARMSTTPVGILGFSPTATMQQGGSRTATGFNQPVVTPPRMATGFSTPQAVMSSRMENVRLASSSRGGTFSRGT